MYILIIIYHHIYDHYHLVLKSIRSQGTRQQKSNLSVLYKSLKGAPNKRLAYETLGLQVSKV